MNGKVTDEAVVAALIAIASGHVSKNQVRAGLEAAVPHLQPTKPEAARLRERAELPEPLDYLRYATQHAINVDDEGVDFAIPRPMIDALAHLNIIEKVARGKWSVNLDVAQKVVSALAATGKQQVGEVQGIDLGQLRELAESWKVVYDPDPTPIMQAHQHANHCCADELLALIDGRDAAPEVE